MELLLEIVALLFALTMESVAGVWKFFFMMTAGLGTVHLLRWIWWRVNAYTEMNVMLSSLVIAIFLETQTNLEFEVRFLTTCGISLFIALVVTFLTPPTSPERQKAFFEKVRPPVLFWGSVAKGKGNRLRELSDLGKEWVLVTTSFLYYVSSDPATSFSEDSFLGVG